MKRQIRTLLLTACMLGLSACSDQTDSVDLDVYRERSKGIAQELKATLGSQLKAAMESGGPVTALQVCKQVAQPLTQGISTQYPDAMVTRTALKVRNPENQANEESTELMELWEAGLSAGVAPVGSIVEGQDRLVAHLPIMTEQVCLTCHGDADRFAPELKQALAELYSEDTATGFAVGDLRGAIRIEFTR